MSGLLSNLVDKLASPVGEKYLYHVAIWYDFLMLGVNTGFVVFLRDNTPVVTYAVIFLFSFVLIPCEVIHHSRVTRNNILKDLME